MEVLECRSGLTVPFFGTTDVLTGLHWSCVRLHLWYGRSSNTHAHACGRSRLCLALFSSLFLRLGAAFVLVVQKIAEAGEGQMSRETKDRFQYRREEVEQKPKEKAIKVRRI